MVGFRERLDEVLARLQERVNHAMREYLPEVRKGRLYASVREYLARREPDPDGLVVYEPIRQILASGGKRLRPALTLLACEACGGDRERAMPAAVGIEFLHTFTLIHDDVMDKDVVRRSSPTVSALWGDPVAITAGDALFALAVKAFTTLPERGVPADRTVAIVQRASEVCLDLARGQTMDLLLARSPSVTEEEALEMVRLKTGVLLEFALEAGAMVAGAKPAVAKGLARFGSPLGTAFQIRDDVLDVTSTTAELGKPRGSDVKSGKRTLLVAHALHHAKPGERARLLEILDTPEEATTPAMVEAGIRILDRAGSIDHANLVAAEHAERARSFLARLPRGLEKEPVRLLRDVAGFVVERRA